MSERIITEKNRVVRHDWIELAGRWKRNTNRKTG